MASISGSGGKMVRARRTATAKTPYDRPDPSNSGPRSPNWLSRLVLSPTRLVASGAGKLFSSVLDLQSSPTPSSASSSSSSSFGSDSGAEEVGTVNHENEDALNKSGTPEVFSFSAKGFQGQPLFGNSKNKHVIEQLLMQETFSREECNRLINIIRSRVVDSPANEDDGDKRPGDLPNRTLGSDTDSPGLCSAAVMEAKKWLQKKKSGIDSNSDLGYGSHNLNLVTFPQAFEDEGSSPVDVAKSYMRTRPPWASPSVDHIKSPPPIGIQLFKEETPYLIGGNSTSSSKLKRDSPATGSWSIQDEIRRVRSRATEQMLRTPPSSKIDWSVFAVEYRNNVNFSAIQNIEARLGEKVHNFTDSIDASSSLARGLSTQASPDLGRKQDGFQPEAVLSGPANINSDQNQAFTKGFGAVQQTEGSGQKHGSSDDMVTMHRDRSVVKVNGINGSDGANHQLSSVEETREALNSRLLDGHCSTFKEKVGAEDVLANGFSSSGPSSYAGKVIEQYAKKLGNETITVDSDQERRAKVVLEQDTCKLLSETSMEVPDVTVNDAGAINEDGRVASGSQNSSSVQHEVQEEYSQPGSESDLRATRSSIAKQQGKRITRYNTRGRDKGVK